MPDEIHKQALEVQETLKRLLQEVNELLDRAKRNPAPETIPEAGDPNIDSEQK